MGMQARMVTNSLLLGFGIVMLLGCIGVVVYFGYIKT